MGGVCCAMSVSGVCRVSGVSETEQSAMDHLASIEVRLDTDGFERTVDGKFRCRYCNYASKGQARLIEHMRTHTGVTRGVNFSSSHPQVLDLIVY